MHIALMSLERENVLKYFSTDVTYVFTFGTPSVVHFQMSAEIVLEISTIVYTVSIMLA